MQLRDAVTTSLDLEKVSRGHKFSFGKASVVDIEERWHYLLYNQAQNARPAELIASQPQKLARAAWSSTEEKILELEFDNPNFKSALPTLLMRHRTKFHWSRTAKALERHYYKSKASKRKSNVAIESANQNSKPGLLGELEIPRFDHQNSEAQPERFPIRTPNQDGEQDFVEVE
eukprot:TRINITY_DN2001_c0_g1_i1.p1 TRINITY_DN2001_c0_g1~~TRINITY_DN2001_c0_g1_i1.p1  ORF type:complete len:174 (+),score=25.13 TRINITY_DN2001_c0_g1_i1:309-830(+)